MAILDTNSSRWIPQYLLLLLLLLLLHSVPYGSGQTTTPPEPQTKPNDPVVIVITVMFIVIFVMVFGSIFCRRRNASFYSRPSVFQSTDADAETRVVRITRSTARGLDAEAILSFPTFLYSEVKAVRIGKGGVECAVCLCEFEDDETLRFMPPCCHVFHADCVDVWLSDHSTCPLCRADLLLIQQGDESSESYLVPDPGTVSAGTDPERGRVLESSDAHLLDGVTWTNSNTTPRSKSTGLSSWRITGILFPRSHSTGHSLVQRTGNLDRFTLRLPDDVRRQLMKKSMTMGHVALLPQARSLRSGYRSGSVGSYGRKNYNNSRRLHSLSFSFSFRSGSVRSTFAGDAPKNLPTSIETGERSFERLRPDDRV